MKNLFIFMTLMVGSMLTHAQTKDAALNRRLAEYVQISKDLDIDKVMDYTYPRLFEVLTKEEFGEQMKQMLNSDKIKINVGYMKILSVDPITTSGATQFTRFKYQGYMDMEMPVGDTTKDVTDFMIQTFEAQFGKGNVTYNAATNTYNIKAIKYSLAIKDKYSNNQWTFIAAEKEENSFINKLLPAAAVKKYKL